MQCTMRIAIFLAVGMLHPLCGGEARADEARSWYVGLGPTYTTLSVDSGQLKSNISSMQPGPDYPPETIDSDKIGAKFYGGYRVTPFLAAEVGYARLGSFGFHVPDWNPFSGAPPDALTPFYVVPGADGHISVSGWSMSAIATLPITDKFELNGRLGLFRSTVRLEGTQSGSGTVIDNTERKTTPLFGIELRYHLMPQVSVTLGGEWMNGLGSAEKTAEIDANTFSLGIQYNFP